MQELRDIRDLEVIPDISFYLFLIMIVVGVLLLSGIAIMIYRHFKGKTENLTRKEVRKRLEEIDFDDPKEAAYKITKYARYLIDGERSQNIFDALEKKLLVYKYRPNPPSFDPETMGEYNLFLEVING